MNPVVLEVWLEIMRHRTEVPPEVAAYTAVAVVKKLQGTGSCNRNTLDVWKEIMRHRTEVEPHKAAEIALAVMKQLNNVEAPNGSER